MLHSIARSGLNKVFHSTQHLLSTLSYIKLLPTWLEKKEPTFDPEPEIHPTAWLDGMRGIAALFVFFYHFAYAYHTRLELGYASGEGNYNIIQLPFIRLLVSGPAMVAIFFLVSGYSLSIASLKDMQNGNSSKALGRIASASFRRPIRLFLPCIVSTFTVMVLVCAGVYTRGDKARTPALQVGFREPNPYIHATVAAQVDDWLRKTGQWLMIWRFDHGNHDYDCHLWTLPVEFRCSILLFIVLVAISNLRAWARVFVLGTMITYCHYTNFWEGWLFYAGALLAQINLLEGSFPKIHLEEIDLEKTVAKYSAWKGRVIVAIFVLSLYLLSIPDFNARDTPGYIELNNMVPNWSESWRFWHCIGSVLLAWSVSQNDSLKRIFDNAFSRYLGRISYGLYLVHGPICHMLGFWLIPYMWEFTGRETAMQYESGFLLGAVVIVAVVFWCADRFTVFVDAPSNKLARDLETFCKN